MHERLIDAAIALVVSEEGAYLTVIGDHARAAYYEPWPAMDALMAALDTARPGWRDQMRDGAANG